MIKQIENILSQTDFTNNKVEKIIALFETFLDEREDEIFLYFCGFRINSKNPNINVVGYHSMSKTIIQNIKNKLKE